MGEVTTTRDGSSSGFGSDQTAKNSVPPRFRKILTVAWLTLGIASVALALMAHTRHSLGCARLDRRVSTTFRAEIDG
jgi:hypothetical protein